MFQAHPDPFAVPNYVLRHLRAPTTILRPWRASSHSHSELVDCLPCLSASVTTIIRRASAPRTLAVEALVDSGTTTMHPLVHRYLGVILRHLVAGVLVGLAQPTIRIMRLVLSLQVVLVLQRQLQAVACSVTAIPRLPAGLELVDLEIILQTPVSVPIILAEASRTLVPTQLPNRLLTTIKGLFGANKTASAFGSSNTGASLFGGGNNNTMSGGGFGSTANTSSAFGANAANNNATTGFGGSSTGGGFGSGGAFGASTTVPMSNQGSAAVPFQAFSEKDGATSSTSSYQSLAFQEPYKNQSFEELRTQDYVQGRRFGNSNGQAGSFGTSTGFGGFGANNNATTAGSSLFGANNNNTAANGASGFGGFGNNNATSNATGGFGASNTGAGLFGAKTGGGLFGGAGTGSASTTGGFGTTSATGGGLFGNSNNNNNTGTSGGFGATNTNTGGGLFGNTTNNTSGFNASNNNTAGGLFGSNDQSKSASTNLFGGANNNNASGGSLFGNNNTSAGSGFGATNNNAGGGLFGASNNTNNNQAKPAFGGFGGTSNASTGGGLFGNTNTNANTNTNTGNSLFGNTANNSSGGGLFGNTNNQNKPAGGLFGASNSATNTASGLFGNSAPASGSLFGNTTNTANNANTSSLFGNVNQNQNRTAGGSLFGNNANSSTGGLSLFGNNNNPNQNQNNSGSSLFGTQNNQNGNSLFGNSQGQQGNQMHAALTSSAYGNDQLFTSLGSSAPPLGPLATPLANARAAPKKTQSLLASVRMNTPVYTPRGSSLGRKNTYGFSYSAYGSPGSAYSMSLTPGANSMLKPSGSLSSGLSSRLTKSMSTNDLRDGASAQASLLRPSMLNPGAGRAYGSGSMRKLNIDRTLREDFFGTPKQSETPKSGEERDSERRVVFDSSANKHEQSSAKPSATNALVRTEVEDHEEASPQTNGANRAEMEQVKETTTNSASGDSTARRTRTPDSKNAEPGAYYTKPTMDQLKRMSRQQLQKMGGLTVGRENIGKIEFGPCDLSSVLLDQICGDIVKLETRAATVYPDIAKKPSVGRGLNVPATISLEKSWPRKSAMKHKAGDTSSEGYRNHVNHLKRIGDTNFIDYDSNTGVWKFSVEHFTTYGLDDDDEELPHEVDTSGLSDAPATSPHEGESTMQSIEVGVGDVDDTFEFKLDQKQMQPPGGYGISFDYDNPSADEEIPDEDMEHEEHYATSEKMDQYEDDADLASSGGPVQTLSPSALALHHATTESELYDEADSNPDMPGSFLEEPKLPRSILKPNTGNNTFASPEKLAMEAWDVQLQRTLSPRKRDRQALRDMQADSWKPAEQEEVIESPFKQSMLGQSLLNQSYLAQKSAKKGASNASLLRAKKSDAFRTSMDIMNSLWENDKTEKHGLEV
nr:nucleoporin [Quercus suber]